MGIVQPDESPEEMSSWGEGTKLRDGLVMQPPDVPSATPPIRKLMLDSCSSEYDFIARGTSS